LVIDEGSRKAEAPEPAARAMRPNKRTMVYSADSVIENRDEIEEDVGSIESMEVKETYGVTFRDKGRGAITSFRTSCASSQTDNETICSVATILLLSEVLGRHLMVVEPS
jgi:hypothetical protein